MKYKFSEKLPEVAIITPDIFYDFRGEYVETWNYEYYKAIHPKINIEWKQDDISTSIKGVLRGLHGDDKTWKLVQCLKGSILVAVVDMKKDSPTYLKSDLFTINEKNRQQVLVPPGYANGHYVLEDCIFSYKQSTLYQGQGAQFTIRWDDPKIQIPWPIKEPLLSSRDRNATILPK